MSLSPAKQVYGIPTYDSLFKWIFSEESLLPSFFHAFIPNLNIKNSVRLDDHMNPLKELEYLRKHMHDTKTQSLMEHLRAHPQEDAFKVKGLKPGFNRRAVDFIRIMANYFDDLKSAFPEPRYDGTMDFVCQLDNNEFAMVEMQVVPENYWDRRALAYVAAFYGNQLRHAQKWGQIKRVIGINILGGGRNDLAHWVDCKDEYVRHYKMEEQLNKNKGSRYLDGIELIQYSIQNAPSQIDDREKQDWLTFFREGSKLNEEMVKQRIVTPAVLEAFERSKLLALPKKVKAGYEAEDLEYSRYSDFTDQKIAEAEAKAEAKAAIKAKIEEKIEVARRMKQKGVETSIIAEFTCLSEAEIDSIK